MSRSASVAWGRRTFRAAPTGRGGLAVTFLPPAAAVAAGAAVAKAPLLAAVAVAGGALLLVLLRVPWLSYVLVVASVSTVAFYSGWPEAHGIKLPELALGAALVATGSRVEWRVPSLPSALMLLFLGATAAGVYVGLRHGTALSDAIKSMRPMVFYAAFWPALVIAADPRWRTLAMRLAAAAVPAVVVLQIAQLQVGLDRPLFAFTSVSQDVVLTPQPDGFLRVRPPALILIYVVTIFSAAYLLWGPRRRRLPVSLVCAAGALGVLVSLNRNMVIGTGLGLVVAAVVVPRRNRVVVAALVTALLLAAAGSVWQADRSGATSSIGQRVLSIGDVAELRAGTLSDRSYENAFAIDTLKHNPLTGIGWGTSYGATLTEYRDGHLVTEPRSFLHQQYLWLWIRTGLIGLLSIVALLGLAATAATRWSRRRAWDDQSWLGPAILASTTALAASATVGTYLSNPDSIVVLVGVLALAFALRHALSPSEMDAVT